MDNDTPEPNSENDATPAAPLDMASIATKDVLPVFLIIAGTVIAGLSVAAAPAGISAIVLGTALPLLWPAQEPRSVWETIASQTSVAINSALEQYAIDAAISDNETQKRLCLELKKSIEDWLASGKTTGASHIRSQYSTFVLIYMANMRQLARANYKSVLLPFYVNAGLNYLSILHDIYPYADELALATRSRFIGSAHVLNQIRENTAELSNQAIESYQYGLEEIIRKSSSSDADQRTSWQNYNKYRNTATHSALDFLAIYRYFDPQHYAGPVAIRNLNRKLLNVLDTLERYPLLHPFNNIKQQEAHFNPPSPPLLLENVTFTSGVHRKQSNLFPYNTTLFDGLAKVECTGSSMDGSDFIIFHPHSAVSRTIEKPSVQIRENMRFIPYIFGAYWDDKVAVNKELPVGSITYLHVAQYKDAKDELAVTSNLYFSQLPQSHFHRQFFEISFPARPNHSTFPDRSFFSERLDSIQIDDFGLEQTEWISTWHHKSLRSDLLPETDHRHISQEYIPVEQFHAIRAAKSIYIQHLRVISGPGFTGGDLVAVGPGNQLSFNFINNQNRWFTGTYHVRLWFYRMNYPLSFEVLVQPGGQFPSSIIRETIPANSNAVNLDHPLYQDLVSHTATASLLLVSDMPSAVLSFTNTSTNTGIILDCIELILNKSGTN